MLKNNFKSENQYINYEKNNDIMLTMVPLLAMSVFMYGIRPIVLVIVALLTAFVSDKIVYKCRRKKYPPKDNGSFIIALIIVFLMPVTVNFNVLIISISIAIIAGRHILGGEGYYPFNPAALGFSVAVISWTDNVIKYPVPFTKVPIFDTSMVKLVAGPATTLSLNGLPNITSAKLWIGEFEGGIGTTFTLILLSCYLLLLVRKRISFLVTTSFLLSSAFFVAIFNRIPASNILEVIKFEIFSGYVFFGAIFLLSDFTTIPKNPYSKLIYGTLLGITTMLFNFYGAFEVGITFAILAINSIYGALDRLIEKILLKDFKKTDKINVFKKRR